MRGALPPPLGTRSHAGKQIQTSTDAALFDSRANQIIIIAFIFDFAPNINEHEIVSPSARRRCQTQMCDDESASRSDTCSLRMLSSARRISRRAQLLKYAEFIHLTCLRRHEQGSESSNFQMKKLNSHITLE